MSTADSVQIVAHHVGDANYKANELATSVRVTAG